MTKYCTIGSRRFVEVEVPFKDEMRDAVLSHRKCVTSRNHDYGAGNVFDLHDGRVRAFIITSVRQHTLGYVALVLYRFEGFDSPEEFIAYWNMLHPSKEYDPDQQVFVHYFEEVPAGNAQVYDDLVSGEGPGVGLRMEPKVIDSTKELLPLRMEAGVGEHEELGDFQISYSDAGVSVEFRESCTAYLYAIDDIVEDAMDREAERKRARGDE